MTKHVLNVFIATLWLYLFQVAGLLEVAEEKTLVAKIFTFFAISTVTVFVNVTLSSLLRRFVTSVLWWFISILIVISATFSSFYLIAYLTPTSLQIQSGQILVFTMSAIITFMRLNEASFTRRFRIVKR